MHRTLLIAVVAGVSMVGRVAAQDTSLVRAGSRVRVTAPLLRLDRHVGVVTRVAPETLVVGSTTVPVALLERVEVSTGRRSWGLAGLGAGFLVGALTGAFVGQGCQADDEQGSAGCVALFAGKGGLIGAVAGAIIGGSISSDRWQEVPADRLRLTATASRDGTVGLAVGLGL